MIDIFPLSDITTYLFVKISFLILLLLMLLTVSAAPAI
jgi:hypothetical protein